MARSKPSSEWITVTEMRHMLSLGRSKAYEILAQEEEIEVARIGSALRVNRASLERWLRSRCYPRRGDRG